MKSYNRLLVLMGIIVVLLLVMYWGVENVKWTVVAFYLGLAAPIFCAVVDRNIMIPMSDGTKLAADIYRPDAPGRFPVILTRTPYGKRNPEHRYEFAGTLFVSQGFIYIVQDVRGKFDSEGEFYPYVNEGKDGHDTIEWAGTQEWSTGRVGTYGFSYWGSTQWLPAPYASECLKAMVPIVTSQNIYTRWIYNGIFRYNDVLFWHYGNSCKTHRELEGVDIEKAVRHLPLIEADNALDLDLTPFKDWIRHPTPGAYWDRVRVDDKVDRIVAPALIIDGWYDYYLDLALDDFNRMRMAGGSPEARQSMILIGPWTHEANSQFEDVDFGDAADFMGQIAVMVRWFNYWLKGEDDGIMREDPVKIFVMGRNQWRTEKEWPLARTHYEKYYLHSDGSANSLNGDGVLNTETPATEQPDRFTYDPADPVPSVGGTSIYGAAVPGPKDQREVEKRDDVLVYSTPPLEEEIEVTGPVTLVLYASSSAKDTDFSAKLVDVYPDGRAINLQAGMVRARFRNSLEEPSFLEKGTVYEFQIKIGSTSNLFKKGHRIRLEVSSSHFPEFGRNLNTDAEIGMTSDLVKADQTIFHDSARPSHLLLPVILTER